MGRWSRKSWVFLAGLGGLVWLCFLQSSVAGEKLNAEELSAKQVSRVASPPGMGRQLWVEETLKSLSLEDKVGQILQIRCFEDYPSFQSLEYQYLRAQLQRYAVASIILSARLTRQGMIRASPADVARLTNRLQRDSKLPLLVASDLERGMASVLKDVPDFPWPMAFGAAGDTAAVERFASVTAREARAVGIHWALAPVADVNSNPANPVINHRSFGEDPAQVAALVTAFIRGAHQNGMLVTAKHFPGNGDVSVDSHRAIALIDADLEHLERIELPPFKAAIASGVDAILLEHARVPALEPDPLTVATISSKVVSELLKGRLGFNGIVLTDALEMRGITGLYDPQGGSPTAQAAVDAVKAGCDVLMTPTDFDGAFHAIIRSVQSGEIPESRIDEAVRKILAIKASLGLQRSRLVDLDRVAALAQKPADFDLAQHVADEAVTLVRDNARMLPLQGARNLPGHRRPTATAAKAALGSASAGAVRQQGGSTSSGPAGGVTAIVLGEALDRANGREFEKALKARSPGAQVFYFDGRVFQTPMLTILVALGESEKVVVAAYVTHRGSRQVNVNGAVETSYGLAGPSGQLLRQILADAREKTAVVVFGSPYLIESFPEIQTYICTYAMASTSEISAVKALLGEIQNHARLPVTLPGIAPRGFSMPWPTKPGKRP
jgi:beta-N-acetylhexosaminidase